MEYRAIYDDEYISHYGVMGMRWGYRKDGGPQGYLGTYSKGGKNWTTKRTKKLPKNYDKKKNVFKNNTKTIDSFLTRINFRSGDKNRYADFKNKGGYSVYESVGITEKMVNVNLTKNGFHTTASGNCAPCTFAAIINKKGGNVMAAPTINGMKWPNISEMMGLIGGKSVELDDTWRQRFHNNELNSMDWINYQMPKNSVGMLAYETETAGHAFYVQKDKDGNIVMFNPQDPTMATGEWTELGGFSGFLTSGKRISMRLSYTDADGEISQEALNEFMKRGYVIPYDNNILPTEEESLSAEERSKLRSKMERFSSLVSDNINLINVAKNFPGPVSVGATLVTSIMKDQMEKLDILNTVAKDAVKRLNNLLSFN